MRTKFSSKITLCVLIIIVAIAVKNLALSNNFKLFIGYPDDSVLDFTELTSKYGYQSEEHTVETEDGYVLKMFRMLKANSCDPKTNLRPVLLMHGLLENSEIFLDAGPDAGLGYLLSDACYDVWIGNQRGNDHARKHITLDPNKDAEFWQFSSDEVALYDVPASINYILEHTGADKINYVGFSQGGGVFFAMCSERPEYCGKTGVMIALAPAVKLDNESSYVLRLIFKLAVKFQDILRFLGVHEIAPKGGFFQVLFQFMCQYRAMEWFCGSGALLDNYNAGAISPETHRVIFSHFLVGASLNTFVRYGQVQQSGRFQKFDYGEAGNMERYRSVQSPEYNLTAVTVPVLILQGANDALVDIKDTKWLASNLPNVLEVVVPSDSKWTHFDILYHRDIKKSVFPKVYEYLRKYG